MPAPAPSWSTVRVHGTWVNQDGSLKAGTYEVKIPVRVTNATDDVIIPAGTFAKGTLNTTNGLPSLDLQIPATDDPDNLPNFQVQITVTFPDALGEQYQIDVPIALQDDANGIDLRAVVLASTFTPTAALIRGVPGGIAGLDAAGRVVDADGNTVTAPDLSGYTTTTDFTAGLSNKVNTSTYTSGLAAKADVAALTSEASTARAAELAIRNLSDSTFSASLSATFAPRRVFDVKTYGAKGDGTTDDTTAINAATAAAEAAGGGIVYLPEATYLATTINVGTRVTLLGDGPGATVIKRKANATGNLVQTKNFTTLATFVTGSATPTPGAPYQFSIRGLSLDGNKANAATAGRGLAICGYDYRIFDVETHHNPGDGFYSEWAGSIPDAGDAQVSTVESHVQRVKSYNNSGNGFWHNGPHDSYNAWLTSASNSLDGFLIQGNAGHWLHCHAWGSHQWAWHLNGEAILTHPIGEGGLVGQMYMEWHKSLVLGGALYFAGQAGSVGLRVGRVGITAAQDIMVKGLAIQQGPGGASIALSPAVDLANPGRNLHLDVVAASTAAAVAVAGTIPADAYVNVQAGGGTTGSVLQLPGVALRGKDAATVPPAIYDHFTAANASAPDATKWTSSTGGGAGAAVVVTGNRAAFTTGSAGSFSAADSVRLTANLAAVADTEVLYKYVHNEVTKESYFKASVRATAPDVFNGARSAYFVQIAQFTNGTWKLQTSKRVTGTNTVLYDTGVQTAVASGVARWVRFRVLGSTIAMRTWLDGDVEPVAWTFSTTDTAVTAGGSVVFETSGSAAAVAATDLLDQAAVYAL